MNVIRRPWLAPLAPRRPDEAHRAATPLELFFDLVIVVAVAQAAIGLHHSIAEAHAAQGVLTYAMVFFGIWWAWVNYTWFSSAYDNDDFAYRLLVLVQLTGALVFAAGIPRFQAGDLRIGVAGYVLMRLALVTLWLRASAGDPARRTTIRRYTAGVTFMQATWIGLLFVPESWRLAGFWTLALGELLVPAWAERVAATPWHPHHIAERYGLLTIITLGESILAASIALQAATTMGTAAAALAPVVVGGLLIVFSLWWLYFEKPAHEVLVSRRAAFVWGYAHYLVFGAAAAVGAGLAAAVDQVSHQAEITRAAAGAAVAVPVAVYLAALWLLYARSDRSLGARVVAPVVVLAVLATPATAQPVLLTGLLVAGLVLFKAWEAGRAESHP